jgi:lipid-binding SYLF domain-containing protein
VGDFGRDSVWVVAGKSGGGILVTKSDKNVWREFCVVGGRHSVWVVGILCG